MRNKINLIAIVSAAFLANPSADKLIVFDDGNCFLPEDKHHADYHGRKENKKGKEVNRQDFEAGIKQLEEDQAAANAKLEVDAKAAALKERALNAGLKQNATEDEVIAAEKEKADAAAKEATDAAAKAEALKARALAVNLPDTATEEEVIAAEAANTDVGKTSKKEVKPKPSLINI